MSEMRAAREPERMATIRPATKAVPDLRSYLVADELVRPFRGFNWHAVIPPTFSAEDCHRPGMVVAIERAIEACPDGGDLITLQHGLKHALAEAPNRNVNLAAVGLLMDTRTRKPDSPIVYLEALTYDLMDEGFPPSVVAAACQRIRREKTFMPEIAEVLTVCREIHKSYGFTLRIVDRCYAALMSAHEVLALAQAAPVQPAKPAPRKDAQPGDPGW